MHQGGDKLKIKIDDPNIIKSLRHAKIDYMEKIHTTEFPFINTLSHTRIKALQHIIIQKYISLFHKIHENENEIILY